MNVSDIQEGYLLKRRAWIQIWFYIAAITTLAEVVWMIKPAPQILQHLFIYLFIYCSSPNFWQQLLSQRRFYVPENKAKRKKTPSSLRAQYTHTHAHSHQLIQSSVSHCYTHGQQKATRILINNVIHPGRRALNPGILAVWVFFSPSSSRSQERCWEHFSTQSNSCNWTRCIRLRIDPRAFCSTSDVHIQMQYIIIFPDCKKRREIP